MAFSRVYPKNPVLTSSAVESRIQVLCNLICVRCFHVISLAALLILTFLYSYAHHVVASSHGRTRMVRNKTHTIAVDKHLKQMHMLFLNVSHHCVCFFSYKTEMAWKKEFLLLELSKKKKKAKNKQKKFDENRKYSSVM